jgi:transcription elongation factor Elf1
VLKLKEKKMGDSITVECKSCDYQNKFILGVGMRYFSLENVIDLVSPTRREEVLKLLQRQDVKDVRYEHKLFVCPNCNNLAERFDFSISYDDGQTYSPDFRCPDCRTKLIQLDKPIDNIPCPNCGEKTLIHFPSVLWD